MSAPPRYTTMLDSVPPAAPPQMSSLVGSEYELLSLRQELERLRRENGRYKEEVFDLKAVALMQQQEARSEAALKVVDTRHVPVLAARVTESTSAPLSPSLPPIICLYAAVCTHSSRASKAR